MMFVGDRGYGLGSSMKGGVVWKPKKHILYIQTVFFCFNIVVTYPNTQNLEDKISFKFEINCALKDCLKFIKDTLNIMNKYKNPQRVFYLIVDKAH